MTTSPALPSSHSRGPRLSLAELRAAAAEMRGIAVTDIFAAGSGHPGGSLSVMDLAACLYLRVLNHDPQNPAWPDRDRVFWSAGHKAPALYVSLAKAGYFPLEDTVLLRQLGSGFEGHPNRLKVPGVEISSGSLGQGLSIAVGDALAARLLGLPYRVYCIMGDGEQQEGSIWEAAMSAGHYKLDNLCAIIDKNRLQIDGLVENVMNVDPLAEKYRAFGWNTLEVDGHNLEEILAAFESASAHKGRPTVLIARTIKGKGVSFMENNPGWHGTAPNKEQFQQAATELATPSLPVSRIDSMLKRAADNAARVAVDAKHSIPHFSRDYWWNVRNNMKAEMDATRMGFGRALDAAGADPRIVTIHADISGSICISDFEAKHPDRANRVFSVGIAEQNMMGVAAGLAREGFIPVTGTYGVFASGRAWDQIRTTICYNNLNVKIAGAHGGVSVGPDGATHQALEEIHLTVCLPNMHVLVPADSIESEKATHYALLEIDGPAYLRFAREATPVISTHNTPYVFGLANVIRYRGEQPRFLDAFDTVVAARYTSENEDASIIACGPMVPEAMRAAWILNAEFGLHVRVLNVRTLKPLDVAAVVRAASETQLVVTVEEYQVGGFGNLIAGAILRHRRGFEQPLLLDMIGVNDRFGLSGNPWELVQAFGLTAEHIAERVLRLYNRKKTAADRPLSRNSVLTPLECSRCHSLTSFAEFHGELLPPSDEICIDCERRSPDICAQCRAEWASSNTNFEYLCRDCRDVPVPA